MTDSVSLTASTSASMVSFVIVALHPSEGLDRCLDSIHGLRYTSELTEVIVVDNSSDQSVTQAVRDRQRGEVALSSGGNIGFAAAVNSGAKAASGRFLALVNDDGALDTEWLV